MKFKVLSAFVLAVGMVLLLALAVAARGNKAEDASATSVVESAAKSIGSPGSLSVNYTADITFTPVATVYLPLVARNYDPRLPYFDDFSDPGSGWYVGDESAAKWSYQSGEYEMLLRNTDWWLGTTSPIGGVDACSIEADMRRSSGGVNFYGLIFSLVDWDRFYAFIVQPDYQDYSIWRNDPTGWSPVVGWADSAYISSSGTNHLKVERNGGQIAIYANGHLLTTASDGTYTGSLEVGLYAQSYDNAPVAVRYDNFRIAQLTTTMASSGASILQQANAPPVGGGLASFLGFGWSIER